MRNRPRIAPPRPAFALAWSALAFAVFGVAGCDSSASKTGTVTQLPEETKQANKSMEDFMKTGKKK